MRVHIAVTIGFTVGPKFSGTACTVKVNDLSLIDTRIDIAIKINHRELGSRKLELLETAIGADVTEAPEPGRVVAVVVEQLDPGGDLAGGILPLAQAIGRVFTRLGEKKNRAKARIKFLVVKLGLEEFIRIVEEERKQLAHDDKWTGYIDELPAWGEKPKKEAIPLNDSEKPSGFDFWMQKNVKPQRQNGYMIVTIMLPLGDLSSHQMRQLADITEKYIGNTIRTTVEQNFILRWVSCLLYTSPSPRDGLLSRMPSSA